MAAADLKRILSQVLPSPALKAQASLLSVQNNLELIEGSLWKINAMYTNGLMTAIAKPDVEQWTDEVEDAISDVDQLLGRILRCQSKEAISGVDQRIGGILRWQQKEAPAKPPAIRGELLQRLTETAGKLNRLAFEGASALGLRAELMDSMDGRRHHEEFSAVLKDEVVGLKDVTGRIIKQIGSQQKNEEIPTIFFIAGHEGMGRTTLARMVFHDEWVRDYFQHYVWVDSPDSFSFDPISVARAVVETVTGKPCGHRNHLQQLWLDVSGILSVGRYLLVIDDVPVLAKDRDKWEQFRHVFLRVGSAGSRILAVTSEHHSESIDWDSFIRLPDVDGLKRDSWKTLLRRRCASALAKDDEDEQNRKSSISDELADKLFEKSRGSPLLAKVWGSVLQPTEALLQEPLQDEQHFRSWSSQYLIPKDAHSYLFSSLFQQNREDDDEDLFHVMVAQGFIQDSSNKALVISNLKRSLCHFATEDSRRQESLTNDLTRSLPILEASSENEKKVLTYWNTKGFPKSTPCQHLSVLIESLTDLTPPVTLPSKLRTLKLTVLVAENEVQKKKKIETVLGDNFSKLRYLRVLDLRATKMARMPDTVGNLVNLRYLNLSCSDIVTLPDSFCDLSSLQILKMSHCYKLIELPHSIGKLQNLQVMKLPFCKKLTKLPKSVADLIDLQELDLECCRRLVDFPDEFGNLKSLRSLNLVGCLWLTKMPSGMRRLTELRKLPRFIAPQESRSCTIAELGPLRNLEDLQLRDLGRVLSMNEAQSMKLKDKRFMRNLVLHWNRHDDGVSSESLLEILECLQPGTALRTLEINSYSGKDFPNWMKVGQPYHYTLTEIKLVNLRNCTSLPPLGLLARLEVVEVSGMVGLREVDGEFYGENGTFASLKKLTFSEMPELQQWLAVTRKSPLKLFPKLSELMIIQCPKLERLEVEFTAVQKLSLWLNNGALLTSESWDWSKFSCVRELEIVGCPDMKHLPEAMQKLNVKRREQLTLIGLDNLESLPNWLRED